MNELNPDFPIWSQENTALAFDDPQVGDHFSEMATYHVFVVDCNEEGIVWCSASAPCSFPKDAKFEKGTPEEFKNRYKYPTNSSKYWVRLMERGVNEVMSWLPTEFLTNSDGELAPFGWLPDVQP
jgi:hypothetical protein